VLDPAAHTLILPLRAVVPQQPTPWDPLHIQGKVIFVGQVA